MIKKYTVSKGLSKHLTNLLPRSCDAAFTAAISLDNLARRPCTDGTRVEIIAQIMSWVNEKDTTQAPPIYWLTGLAGLGKTTIAYTICKLLEDASQPFVSFFCSLQLDSKNPKLLVTTLCRDLAELYDSYAVNLLSTVETNSKAVDAVLRLQMDQLLAKPWKASIAHQQDEDTPPPIVVVDALDENERGIEFLEELLRVIRAGQLVGIKFLVTSRTDPKIVKICRSFPPNAVCKLHEVDTADVQKDIQKYLQEALPELNDEPELALLAERAGGFFIYATTAVRFISPPRCNPAVSEMRSLLQAMVNPDALSSPAQNDERLLVDELYERILVDAFRDGRLRATRLRILHTIICAESRVNISVLATLTDTDPEIVSRVVESLHAVLFVSSKDDCVYWYHASFPDFIFSQTPKITIDIFCAAAAHHGYLARRCFSIMQKFLRFNMCYLPSSFAFDDEVPGLSDTINETLSPSLQYASRHWARHLVRAEPVKNEASDLSLDLKQFLCDKLLFWIETMNLMGSKSEMASLLRDAESWLRRVRVTTTISNQKCILMHFQANGSADLLEQLTDATNFSTFFAGSPASKSTPHLYISALSMWNQDSAIWKHWKHRFKSIPSVLQPKGTITLPLLTIRTMDSVCSIAFSPDGNRIVTGSVPVQVWDARTGEQLRDLRGHSDFVIGVAFSPDGNQIVSGSYDKSVRVWDAETGEQLGILHISPLGSVAFSPDGNQIVTDSSNSSVRVWDAKTGELLNDLLGHANPIHSATFSPDGNQIVSGSFDKSLQVWDAKTGEQLSKLLGHSREVNSVAFSPDSNRIVSGSWDNSVRVWDAKTGKQLMELQGHTDTVESVAFSPDGNEIVSSSWDKSVRVWDAKNGEQLRNLLGHTNIVSSVAFSPDGNQIVSGSFDRSVRVWDAKTREEFKDLVGHTHFVNSVAFSPDGNQIVSGAKDRSVRVWDSKTGEPLWHLEGHTSTVHSVAFSPDNEQIVSCSDLVRVWDAKSGEQLRDLQGHTDAVHSVSFSPDGNRIVTGSDDKSVRVWDPKSGKLLWALQSHTDKVHWVTFSPDGNQILSGSWDKSVRVWDAHNGEQLAELLGHNKMVLSAAFSPDGNKIVSGSQDPSVRVWDAKTGVLLRELQGHTNWVNSVAFSPDGNQIVSGSRDGSVRVWDAKTGVQFRELSGHTMGVLSVAFSPDGNRIVSGSEDSSVRVWHNLYFYPEWVVMKDGWIVSDGERLVWVPSTISDVLLRPHNSVIISRHGSATISFAQCDFRMFGTLWDECYTP